MRVASCQTTYSTPQQLLSPVVGPQAIKELAQMHQISSIHLVTKQIPCDLLVLRCAACERVWGRGRKSEKSLTSCILKPVPGSWLEWRSCVSSSPPAFARTSPPLNDAWSQTFWLHSCAAKGMMEGRGHSDASRKKHNSLLSAHNLFVESPE